MRHRIAYAVINPYWRAPRTIVKEDIIPRLKRGEFEYLCKKGIIAALDRMGVERVDLEEVDIDSYEDPLASPYIFLQEPGPKNVLGRVKFIFPNPYAVYLHDTNRPYLFERHYRALSSGCVRVKNPVKFFGALLDGEREKEKEIFDIIKSGERRVYYFRPRPPIYLAYLTVYAKDGKKCSFYPDIYGYDRRMIGIFREYIQKVLKEGRR
jgi:murein L,D-transpeptidase YcbB/YkuD